MDLFEYQAKDLFAEYGVPVQPGQVASTAEEARDIAAAILSSSLFRAPFLESGGS